MNHDITQPESSPVAAKMAIVQALLTALIGDAPSDATLILANTYRGGKTDESSHAVATIPSLVLGGHSLEALAACHTALNSLTAKSSQTALRPKIEELRKVLELELLAAEEIELATDGQRIHLLPRRAVLIGRPSAQEQVDVAVNCLWFSRGERNLSLYCKGPTWLIEDLGSTNGSFVDGRVLKRGEPLPLPHGETRVEIGKTQGRPAPVVISLRRPLKDAGAVVIAVTGANNALAGSSDPWPSMQADMKRRWVVFREQVGVGASEDVAIPIPSRAAGTLAAIRYRNGFWILPSAKHKLTVNGVPFRAAVPICPGAEISVGGAILSVRKSEPPERSDYRPQAQAS
jgi:hypothetical protein